jgi:peroxin-1
MLPSVKILKAVARKMTFSPTVDFDEIASKTEGFSGADLQALLYNAHLDVIHRAIAEAPSDSSSANTVDEAPVKYTTIGGSTNKTILSKAEEMALQRRVRSISLH